LAYEPASDRSASTWSADEAVTELFTLHYRPLVRLGVLLLHDTGAAEEIVQDAFVALHAHWGRLDDPYKALAYLRQTVLNRSRSALRHRGVVDRFLRREAPPATVPSAEVSALNAVAYAEVLTAVRALPIRQREALVLRYYGDLSQERIGAQVGLSQVQISRVLDASLAKMRTALETS